MNLTAIGKADFKNMKNLYFEAFPRNERKPFSMIMKNHRKEISDIFVLKNNEDLFLGFIITVKYMDLIMVDYLAIASNARGTGAGTEILHFIEEYYKGKRILLLIEQPDESAENNIERLKRKNFYLKNGYHDTGIVVVEFGITLEILAYGGKICEEDYLKIQRYVYGNFLMWLGKIRIKK